MAVGAVVKRLFLLSLVLGVALSAAPLADDAPRVADVPAGLVLLATPIPGGGDSEAEGNQPEAGQPRGIDVTSVPEPASLVLIGLGLLGLGLVRRRRPST